MSTLFEDAWQDGGALDEHFGEAFTIMQVAKPSPTSRIDVNAPARPIDPGAPLPFIGIYRSVPADRFPESRGHSASDSQMVTSGLTALEYQVAVLPFAPRLNDIITRLKDNTVYQVADPGDVLFGRRRMKLTAKRG